jgi:hypothetical protein
MAQIWGTFEEKCCRLTTAVDTYFSKVPEISAIYTIFFVLCLFIYAGVCGGISRWLIERGGRTLLPRASNVRGG